MNLKRSQAKKYNAAQLADIQTWGEALAWGMELLTDLSPTPKEDCLRLLTDCHFSGLLAVYQVADQPIPRDFLGQYANWVEARRQGWPIAYLTHRQDFWQDRFWVNQQVLIPRPDTELLVEWALKHSNQQVLRCLELGVGSGAVILSIAKMRPLWSCVGVDVSREALAVARLNRRRLSISNAVLKRSDWFGQLEGERYQLIVSNPPYIEAHDNHLAQGDLRFEPNLALASGLDGLDALRQLIALAPAHLTPGGWLGVEHGAAQQQSVQQLFQIHGFANITTQVDSNGLPRITFGQI